MKTINFEKLLTGPPIGLLNMNYTVRDDFESTIPRLGLT